RRYPQAGSTAGAMFSSFPVVSEFGLFYQCMGNFGGAAQGRYALCWSHNGITETLAFPGHVFRPTASASDASIRFELVSGRRSTMMRFDPMKRMAMLDSAPSNLGDEREAVSADGRWVAFTRGPAGARELWVRTVASGQVKKIAGGQCDNGEPAWDPDSSA